MNNINTPIKRNSGLQAAEFHLSNVCTLNWSIACALHYERYSVMPDGVWHERYLSLQNKTHEVRLTNVKNVSNVTNHLIVYCFEILAIHTKVL